MTPLKRYLWWSIGLHLLLLVVGCIVTALHGNKSAFVVFGAHSRYNAKIHYRPVPFKSLGKKKGTGGSSDNASGKSKKAGFGKKSKQRNQKKSAPIANKKSTTSKQKDKKRSKKQAPAAAPTPKKAKQKIKKKTPVKELVKEKEVEPEPEPIKEQEAQPEPEPVVEPEPEPEPIQEPEQEPVADNVEHEDTDTEDGDEGDEDDDGFSVEGDYDGTEIAQFHRLVQQEIDRLWRPPIGVPQGTVCSILFKVNADDGTVESCTFAARSRVLIYDLGVMKIARQLKFHTALWGKAFKIDFRQ